MIESNESLEYQENLLEEGCTRTEIEYASPANEAVAMLNCNTNNVSDCAYSPKNSINLSTSTSNNSKSKIFNLKQNFHAIDHSIHHHHNNNHTSNELINNNSMYSSNIDCDIPKMSSNICDDNKFNEISPQTQATVITMNNKQKCDTKVLLRNGDVNCVKAYDKSQQQQPQLQEQQQQELAKNTTKNARKPHKRRNSVTSSVSVTSSGPSNLMRFALGIMLTVLSAFFFSLTTVIVKHVTEVKPSEMALYRFIGIFLMVFPVVVESKEPWFGPNCWWFRLWMVLRGVCGATSLFFRYSAVSYISLADTTIIVLSLPVFVFIFARIFLKEPFGRFHVVALILSLIGICFASKIEILFGSNDDSEIVDADAEQSRINQLIGTSFAIGAMIIGSLVYVFVRKMRKTHHSVILFNFAIIAIIEMLIVNGLTIGLRFPPTNSSTPWLIMALGMLSFYGQLLLTKAVQLEEAGVVSVVRVSSEAFFAFVLEIIFFDHVPDFYSTIGAVLVLSSVILLTIRKYIVALPDGSDLKTRFIYLTK